MAVVRTLMENALGHYSKRLSFFKEKMVRDENFPEDFFKDLDIEIEKIQKVIPKLDRLDYTSEEADILVRALRTYIRDLKNFEKRLKEEFPELIFKEIEEIKESFLEIERINKGLYEKLRDLV